MPGTTHQTPSLINQPHLSQVRERPKPSTSWPQSTLAAAVSYDLPTILRSSLGFYSFKGFLETQEATSPFRLLFIGVVQSCRNLKIDSERQSKVQELSHIFLAEALPGAGERTSVGGAEPVSARWGRGAYLHCLMTFCHYILYTI
jgi:hypothetical protein